MEGEVAENGAAGVQARLKEDSKECHRRAHPTNASQRYWKMASVRRALGRRCANTTPYVDNAAWRKSDIGGTIPATRKQKKTLASLPHDRRPHWHGRGWSDFAHSTHPPHIQRAIRALVLCHGPRKGGKGLGRGSLLRSPFWTWTSWEPWRSKGRGEGGRWRSAAKKKVEEEMCW
jgi:hypothetical protein